MGEIQEPGPRGRRACHSGATVATEATSSEVKRLVSAAFAPSTQVAYRQGVHLFEKFRSTHGVPLEWPTCQQHVIHFAAHLSLAGKAPATIRAYIAGISCKHKLNGWVDPTDNFLLRKMFQGLARTNKRQDSRLPITFDRLQQLIGVLHTVCTNAFERRLFAAVFTLAFFGLFRVSEIVGQDQSLPGGRSGLQNDSIRINEDLLVTVGATKTDQEGRGGVVKIKKVLSHPEVCPVANLRAYLLVRPAVTGALFIHFNGKPLSSYQFQAVLKKGANTLGWSADKFTSHSFRIGATTTRLGRWRSAVVKSYVRCPSS